jgi:hypothetical protein
VNAHHQVALAVVGAEHLHVGRGKAGVEQALGHGLAASVVLPTESVVLISINCWKMSRASWRLGSSAAGATPARGRGPRSSEQRSFGYPVKDWRAK